MGGSGGSLGGTGGSSAGSSNSAGGSSGEGGQGSDPYPCVAERDALLTPIEAVSSRTVAPIGTGTNPVTLFVDATGGGLANFENEPWVYVSLANAARVDITDSEAYESHDWDLAFQRNWIRVNGGDSGPGLGAAAHIVAESINDTEPDDFNPATLGADDYIDDTAGCASNLDDLGGPVTRFDDALVNDPNTSLIVPQAWVFFVRSADGNTVYELEIESYYSEPDGGDGGAGANYRIVYAPLQL
jgi:hypothetical protein